MPKTPITYRETFFSEVRGNVRNLDNTPQIKHLEWNRVETELGTMVEPRGTQLNLDSTGKTHQIDMTDAAFNKISMIDENIFYTQFGTSGGGLIDYNA
jgi:hypothetical protein